VQDLKDDLSSTFAEVCKSYTVVMTRALGNSGQLLNLSFVSDHSLSGSIFLLSFFILCGAPSMFGLIKSGRLSFQSAGCRKVSTVGTCSI
jgi:hypothetical protein